MEYKCDICEIGNVDPPGSESPLLPWLKLKNGKVITMRLHNFPLAICAACLHTLQETINTLKGEQENVSNKRT